MHSLELLRDLATIMVVAGFTTLLFHHLKQPLVLGYLLAGMLVGPYTPPTILVHDEAAIRTLADLGLVFIMFGIGLGFSLKHFLAAGPAAVIAASLETILMMALGYGMGQAFGWAAIDSLFLGGMMAISSTTLIIKTLSDLKLMKQRFVQSIMAIIVVEDVLGVLLLVALSGVAVTGKLQIHEVLLTLGQLSLFLVGAVVVGLLTIPRLIRHIARFRHEETMLVSVLGLCLGAAFLAAELQYSVALGAFLMGALIGETRESAKITQLFQSLRDMFSAVFFVTAGMLIDPQVLLEYWLPILLISLAVICGKMGACAVGTLAAGGSPHTALRVGVGMAQIGEFSFIIAQLGLSLNVLNPTLYPIIVTVSAITCFISPYLMRHTDRFAAGLTRVTPNILLEFIQVYHQWVTSFWQWQKAGASANLRQMVTQSFAKVVLDILLATGIVLASAKLESYLEEYIQVPIWLGGSRTLVWLLGMLLSLPLLVHAFFKLRALAMILTEITLSRLAPSPATTRLKNILIFMIAGLADLALGIWLVLVSLATFPPWPVLLVMVALLFVVATLLLKHFNKLYLKAQVQIEEVLHPLHVVEELPLPVSLQEARLEKIMISLHSLAHGKLIGELEIRSQTGVSVVGIMRGELNLVNPGPEEELNAGDHVLLLGTPQQLQSARRLFLSE